MTEKIYIHPGSKNKRPGSLSDIKCIFWKLLFMFSNFPQRFYEEKNTNLWVINKEVNPILVKIDAIKGSGSKNLDPINSSQPKVGPFHKSKLFGGMLVWVDLLISTKVQKFSINAMGKQGRNKLRSLVDAVAAISKIWNYESLTHSLKNCECCPVSLLIVQVTKIVMNSGSQL